MTLPALERRRLRDRLAPYGKPSRARSLIEILVTAGPLLLLWGIGWSAAALGWWWAALLLAVPAAAFLVRLFLVQHDCGHHAFFASAAANDWVGRVIGVLTLTPYDCWRRTHAIHHASSGDLDRRTLGGVDTLTVGEYRALGVWRRAGYRLYRHPLVMFGVGPAYVFLLEQRLPRGLMREGWRPWVSAMATNAATAAALIAIAWVAGWQGMVLVILPTVLLAASIGVWLFYVQHQFEHTSWRRHEAWDLTEAALHGSSHYDLPRVLRWLTANIGVHHIHHLSSRIPFYRLQAVLRDNPILRTVSRMTLRDSLRCVGLSLWDEAGGRLISFRDFARLEASPALAC